MKYPLFLPRKLPKHVDPSDREVVGDERFVDCRFWVNEDGRIIEAWMSGRNDACFLPDATRHILLLDKLSAFVASSFNFYGRYVNESIDVAISSGRIKRLILNGHVNLTDAALQNVASTPLLELSVTGASLSCNILRLIRQCRLIEMINLCDNKMFFENAEPFNEIPSLSRLHLSSDMVSLGFRSSLRSGIDCVIVSSA